MNPPMPTPEHCVMRNVWIDTLNTSHEDFSVLLTHIACKNGGRTASIGGAHPRGGSEGPEPPRGLKNIIFSGFLPVNYVISIFEVPP